jgi:amino acid permease
MGLFGIEKAASSIASLSGPRLNEVTRSEGKSKYAALLNLGCLLAGTGMLGLPVSLRQGGWVAVILIPLAAALAVFCGRLQVDCHYPRPDVRLETYGDVGQEAFGKPGKIIVEIFSALVNLGSCILYVIFIGDNLRDLAKDWGFVMGVRYWMIIAGVIVTIPVILIKTLKEATLLGLFGALASVVVVVISCVLAFMDLPRQQENEVIHVVVDWQGFPIALTTLAFAYGACVVYPHLEHSMRHPQQFSQVLIYGLATVATLYTFIASVGYAIYGHTVESPIFKNVPNGPAVITAVIIITIHTILVCPLFMCSFALDFEAGLGINEEKYSKVTAWILRVSTRAFFGVLITLVAMFLPFFEHFMSFAGAISMSVLTFVIPIICHLKIFGFKGRSIFSYLIMVVCLILGIVCFIFGSIDSVKLLVNDFKMANGI